MDISKLKELLQSIFKNYSSLLVPAAIGLAAVLVFIPTQLMSGKLRRQIEDESIRQRLRRIKSLSGDVVSQEQWKVEEGYQKVLRNDANKVSLWAQQTSQRQLLSYKIFPEPKGRSALIFDDFSEQFCIGVSELLGRINARDCPSRIELERALQDLSRRAYRPGRKWDKPRGGGTSGSRLKEAKDTIIDVLCEDKAKSATVYANPTDVSGYEFWAEWAEYEPPERDEALEDCWYWQLAYWIIEDVINTIDALNSESGSKSVLTSPVKQLVSISFGRQIKRPKAVSKGRSGAGVKGATERPKYVISLEDALAWPCTGRFCNNDIDVVHFNVVVAVSSRSILSFMQELCSAKQHIFKGWDGEEPEEQVFTHNQITILDSMIESINREDSEHEYYRYGEDAVVELSLVCEYIFNKAAYDEAVKPKAVTDAIKKVLEELEADKASEEKRKLRQERKAKGKAKTKAKSKGRRQLPEY